MKDISTGPPPPDDKLLAEFDKYDINGDQTVDMKEFQNLVKMIFIDLMTKSRLKIKNKMNSKRLNFTTYSSPESYYYENGKMGLIC